MAGEDVSTIASGEEQAMKQPPTKGPRKFSRIRNVVEKLNDEFLTTLHEAEQRHKDEVAELRKELLEQDGKCGSLTEQKEQLENKIETLSAQQQEHLNLIKKASERIMKMESKEQEHLSVIEKAAKKIKILETQDNGNLVVCRQAEEQVKQLEAQMKEHRALAEEAKSRIKELEGEQQELKTAYERINKELEAQEEELKHAYVRIKELEEKEKELHDAREKIKTLRPQKRDFDQALGRITELDSLEQDLSKAHERIKKLEYQEANQRLYVKKAEERIALLESQARKKNSDKVNEMEAREEKVMALAKKAAQKIKELETREKKHAEFSKNSAVNIKKLKHMLLGKQDELESLQKKALMEMGVLAQDLARTKNEQIWMQTSLEEARNKYVEEHELRKADQKKISSLRKMIEQYDAVGVECTFSDLSQALSEESNEVNPLTIYRAGAVKTQEDFEHLQDKIFACIPDSVQMNFNKVGFFETGEYHFPVLALGPFDVPPGPIRNKWLEKANTSLGIYYFGQKDESLAYDLIPAESFIPYYEGVKKNLNAIPMCITKKADTGEKLSLFEEILVDGLKEINVEADTAPGDRYHHPLKNFKEIFSGQNEAMVGPSRSLIEVNPSEMLETLKVKLCACSGGKEQILQELDMIEDEAPTMETATTQSTMEQEVKKVESEKNPMASMKPDSVCTPGINSMLVNSFDSDSGNTMNSLEKQMNSFIADLAAGNKSKKPTPKASMVAEEARESHVSSNTAETERREDTEKVPTSLVKQRLAMFGGSANTKNVMQMWKQKAAGNSNSTPKHGNVASARKSFEFNNAAAAQQNKSNKVRSVTIPKAILKKIEAGESLSDHEKEILEGIQKYKVKSSSSSASDEHLITQTSTLSAVTAFEGPMSAE